MFSASSIISSSTCKRPAVSTHHHVAQVVDGVLDALLRDLHRILAVAAVHAHADLAAEGFQLVGPRRGGTSPQATSRGEWFSCFRR